MNKNGQQRKVGFAAFAAIALATSLNPINSSLIATAYVDIASEFNVSFAEVSLLLTFYLACTAAFLPLSGALGDRIGRRRCMTLGVVGLTLCSALATQVENYLALLLWRSLQAVFSAIILPNAIAQVRTLFPVSKQAKILGWVTAISTTSAAAGFPLGALLTEAYGWRALFWFNVPLGVLSLLLITWALSTDKVEKQPFTALACIALPVVPFMLGWYLMAYQQMPIWAALFFIVAVISWVICFHAMWRREQDRIVIRSLANSGFIVALLVVALLNAIIYSVFFITPTWLDFGFDLDRRLAGIFMGVMIIAMSVGSSFSGRMFQSMGSGYALLLSSIGVFFSLSTLLMLSPGVSHSWIVIALFLTGVTVSAAAALSQHLALISVPERNSAMAMGIYTCVRYLGGIIGTSVVSLILADADIIYYAEGQLIIQVMLMAVALPLCILVACVLKALPREG